MWSRCELLPRKGRLTPSSPGLGDGRDVRAERVGPRQRADKVQVNGPEGAHCSISAATEDHVLGQRQGMGRACLQGRTRKTHRIISQLWKNKEKPSRPSACNDKGYRRLQWSISASLLEDFQTHPVLVPGANPSPIRWQKEQHNPHTFIVTFTLTLSTTTGRWP